jgi:hypothetical protein
MGALRGAATPAALRAAPRSNAPTPPRPARHADRPGRGASLNRALPLQPAPPARSSNADEHRGRAPRARAAGPAAERGSPRAVHPHLLPLCAARAHGAAAQGARLCGWGRRALQIGCVESCQGQRAARPLQPTPTPHPPTPKSRFPRPQEVPFDLVQVDLSAKPGWYRSVNGRGLVPAVQWQGETTIESVDIVRWGGLARGFGVQWCESATHHAEARCEVTRPLELRFVPPRVPPGAQTSQVAGPRVPGGGARADAGRPLAAAGDGRTHRPLGAGRRVGRWGTVRGWGRASAA